MSALIGLKLQGLETLKRNETLDSRIRRRGADFFSILGKSAQSSVNPRANFDTFHHKF